MPGWGVASLWEASDLEQITEPDHVPSSVTWEGEGPIFFTLVRRLHKSRHLACHICLKNAVGSDFLILVPFQLLHGEIRESQKCLRRWCWDFQKKESSPPWEIKFLRALI